MEGGASSKDKIEANVEEVYREARRKDYLLHLWEVNRPHYSETVCLDIIAPRAGYTRSGAYDALKKMGIIKPKIKGKK